ncbi:MAG: transposase [Bacteroidetes bacterium]|nr:transposase [Bacteroidota bacterium]
MNTSSALTSAKLRSTSHSWRGSVRRDFGKQSQKLQLFFKSLKLDPRKTLVCLEHTGVYNIHLVEVLCKLGFHVWLESALRIKRSIGMVRGKSDKIDAGRIAKYAFLHQEQANLWIPSREIIKSLKSLLSQRARLIKAKLILITPIEELAGLGLKKNLATLKRSFDPHWQR